MTPIHVEHENQCFKCCLLSILDLPYDAAPDFWSAGVEGERFMEVIYAFCRSRGIRLVEAKLKEDDIEDALLTMSRNKGMHYIIAGAIEGREASLGHAVVACGQELIYNPSPGEFPKLPMAATDGTLGFFIYIPVRYGGLCV